MTAGALSTQALVSGAAVAALLSGRGDAAACLLALAGGAEALAAAVALAELCSADERAHAVAAAAAVGLAEAQDSRRLEEVATVVDHLWASVNSTNSANSTALPPERPATATTTGGGGDQRTTTVGVSVTRGLQMSAAFREVALRTGTGNVDGDGGRVAAVLCELCAAMDAALK
jgi:hypothetical protein